MASAIVSEVQRELRLTFSPFVQDIAGTLATEEAEDFAHVNKLRSALESVDVKRRKVVACMSE